MNQAPQFFGKYRGAVVDHDDPLQLGRLRVRVPDVTGEHDSTWALPCLPAASKDAGLWTLPPVGTHVWVEYEHGDPGRPIWVGCFWTDEAPPPAREPQQFVIQTPGKHSLRLDDRDDGGVALATSSGATIRLGDKGVTIEAANGAKIVLDDRGITVDNGHGATVVLEGPKVAINGSALQVI